MRELSHPGIVREDRSLVVGEGQLVPVLNGQLVRYVNLDNAASTPALQEVSDSMNRFMEWYASVHRGTGFKSRLSTAAYDEAHEITGRFFGANPATNTVIFVRNTTEAINKLANRIPFGPGDVVLTTFQEHHSNDLPWRRRARVDYIAVDQMGALVLEDIEAKLRRYEGRVRLVTVTGASNVTGFVNPIHNIARMAHQHGARLMVDAAQLAPHRPIDMLPDDDPAHIDYLVVSGHKMYAPFGTGALIGPANTFLDGDPDLVGGGTVDIVTHDFVKWTSLPDKEEAGSPNVPGAVAMAKALQVLSRIGMENVAAHEAELTAYALRRLKTVPGLLIYGDADPERVDRRVGVIPFAMEKIPFGLVAAILGYEGGIGVRAGCFCAHPYVMRLAGVTPEESAARRQEVIAGDRSRLPGFVRASFGLYSTAQDVDRLVEMLQLIARGDYRGKYRLDLSHGTYAPEGHEENLAAYWNWE